MNVLRVVFEPTIPAFERAKTVHVLHRAAIVFDVEMYYDIYIIIKISSKTYWHTAELITIEANRGHRATAKERHEEETVRHAEEKKTDTVLSPRAINGRREYPSSPLHPFETNHQIQLSLAVL
jgi:hypothetical protein